MKDAIFLDVTRADMRLYGWISGPKFQRSQNDRQWVYLNQRMVKDKLLHHAIKQAYDGLLHPGRFPACVLYFSMNHGEVDVNVHPTKHEVRFQQPRLVHDFFTSQLTAALQAKEEPQYQPEVYAPRESVSEVCEPYPQLASLSPRITFAETEVPWTLLHTNYILTFIEQQPYVVSLLALHQRALQEQLASVDLPLARRPLLVPVRYAFDKYSPELGQNLEQLGIQSECIDGGELLIRSIPIALPYLDLPLFLSFVAELEQFELTNLLDLMIQAQVFDPRLLSGEEKMALHHLLVNSVQENIGSLYKKLTPEDCQNLVSESL